MKILNPDYSEFKIMGKDYYTIIVDKKNKELFALLNLSCRAAEEQYLSAKFTTERHLICDRFSFIFSGNSIDANRIPKKYTKYKILQ